jgi:hypothetical protein
MERRKKKKILFYVFARKDVTTARNSVGLSLNNWLRREGRKTTKRKTCEANAQLPQSHETRKQETIDGFDHDTLQLKMKQKRTSTKRQETSGRT